MAETNVQRGRFLEYQDGELIDPEAGAHSDEENAFQNFREQLRAGDEMATLRVSKIPKSGNHPSNSKGIFCFACPIDRYTFDELLEFLADNYGGGIYRLIAVKNGQKGTAFNRLVEIAEALKPKNPDQPQNTGAVMESVANLINQQQERTEALFTRLMGHASSATPQADPFAMFERFAGLFATLGLIGGNKGGPDLLGELKRMNEMRGLLQDFAGDEGGGERRESNAYDLIGKTLDTFGPAFLQAINSGKTTRVRQVPRLPGKPAAVAPPRTMTVDSSGTVTPPQNSPPPKEGANSMKAQIETLVRNAQKGVAPEAMAQTVIAMTPEAQLPALRDFIGAPDCIARMEAQVSSVAAIRPWFEALRNNLLAELSPGDLSESEGMDTFDGTAPEDSV